MTSVVEGPPGEVPAEPSDPMHTVGGRIRDARSELGMSLRESARQLGVSPSFLSQLENGKSLPSVSTLYQLSKLYGVSIDQLFMEQSTVDDRGPAKTAHSAPDVSRSEFTSPKDAWTDERSSAHMRVVHPDDRAVIRMDNGVVWQQLASNTDQNLDFMEIEYPPGCSSTSDGSMLRHDGFEYGILIEGTLEVTHGFETVTLHAGDSIGLNSARPHVLKNPGDVPARGIWVVQRCAFAPHS